MIILLLQGISVAYGLAIEKINDLLVGIVELFHQEWQKGSMLVIRAGKI
ncbi:hypothetical protein [Sporomusa sp. KB1]|nr:hypothetical protein [Sporomusa sp. KB1]